MNNGFLNIQCHYLT